MITSLTNVICLDGVGKKYPLLTDFWALKEISLEVSSGEILGIIGRNGAGKTTLLNILAGTLSSTEGECSIQGKVLGLFNLGVGFQDELSGRENIFLNGSILGATRKELETKFTQISEFSELGNFINMPLGSYSTGMRLRLAFSIVVTIDFDILVIDEVLAVGDMLFQNKCFERLMDFRRQGKTMVITSQNIELMERLCNRALVLDHGRSIFCGAPGEAVVRYRQLLDTEKLFFGPKDNRVFFSETKKWSEDKETWGKKLGTKEIIIDSVRLLGRSNKDTDFISHGETLTIKASLIARDKIIMPHVGIAIFREDGVYCYGTNTANDHYPIPEINPGLSEVSLAFPAVPLESGRYRISVAVWDKIETLAYDYHNACYPLGVNGESGSGALAKLPFNRASEGFFSLVSSWYKRNKVTEGVIVDILSGDVETEKISVDVVNLSSRLPQRDGALFTNDAVSCAIKFSCPMLELHYAWLWLGIYRNDGVLCQKLFIPVTEEAVRLKFPSFAFLPGSYRVALGLWQAQEKRFVLFKHNVLVFRMVFDRPDHGTIYIPHSWKYSNKT